MRARDGARGGSDVIAVIGAGLTAVGKLVDGDLVHIARACGIAADRRIIVEHAVDHGPGIGLAHGIRGASDGGDTVVRMKPLESTSQAGENRRGLRGVCRNGRSRSSNALRGSPLLLGGHRGGLGLILMLVDVRSATRSIGLEQALGMLRAIFRNAERGGIDTDTRHRTHGKRNSARDDRLVYRRKRQRGSIHHHGSGKADSAGKSSKDYSLCCIRRSHELSPSSSAQIASFSWLRERR